MWVETFLLHQEREDFARSFSFRRQFIWGQNEIYQSLQLLDLDYPSFMLQE